MNIWKNIELSSSLITTIENIEYPGSLSEQGFPLLLIDYRKKRKGKIDNEKEFWDSLKPSRSDYHPEIDHLLRKTGKLEVIPEFIVPIENHDLWETLGGSPNQSSIRFDWWASGWDIENDHNNDHPIALDNIRDRYTRSLGMGVIRIKSRDDYVKLIDLSPRGTKPKFHKNNSWLWWVNYEDELRFIDWYLSKYGFPIGPYSDGTYRITYDQIQEKKKYNKPGPWAPGSNEDYFTKKLVRVCKSLYQIDLVIKDTLREDKDPSNSYK